MNDRAIPAVSGFLGLRTGGFARSQLLTAIAARRISVYPVPELGAALAAGFDPDQPGVSVASTPRAANVLLLTSPLSVLLRKAAAIAFVQMPRPRLFVTLGEIEKGNELPPSDAVLQEKDLQNLQRILAPHLRNRQSRKVVAFAPHFLRKLAGEEAENDEGEEADDDNGNGHEHHEHHEHEDGFMSMVMMTKDMPRGSDGLAMEPVEAYFGPFHPGLPDGVKIKLILGGDTVRNAEWAGGKVEADLGNFAQGDLDELASVYSGLYRILPETRRTLVENATGRPVTFETVCVLERERIVSHLSWLVSFARLLGYRRLIEGAAIALREARQGPPPISSVERLEKLVQSAPYLKKRLRGIGRLSTKRLEGLSGPVVRAAGIARDVRGKIAAYQELKFEPIAVDGNDAFSRLWLRLREISQSIDLIQRASNRNSPVSNFQNERKMWMETPQGAARIHLLNTENETAIRLASPLPDLLAALPEVANQAELSDALVAIASLDPSPWLHPLRPPPEKSESANDEKHHSNGGHPH